MPYKKSTLNTVCGSKRPSVFRTTQIEKGPILFLLDFTEYAAYVDIEGNKLPWVLISLMYLDTIKNQSSQFAEYAVSRIYCKFFFSFQVTVIYNCQKQ